MVLEKVLIANRGEIAVRVARTCRSLGIGTVAVFSDADAGSLHVEVCDEAVRLPGTAASETYLDADALVAAARRTGADAVHPGYGFLAERAAFARAVADAGLTWIGPSAETIAVMGDKLEAKRRMAEAGVPLLDSVALTDGVDVAEAAGEIGFPVIVKAAAGGGGKGMRVVTDPADMEEAVAAARREAEGAFGDGRLFLERFVTRPHHVEVQVLGDNHGNVVHLFERECSIQRRHQKVVEETPSPVLARLGGDLRTHVCDAAVAAAKALGYVNAGTVEFVVDAGAEPPVRTASTDGANRAYAGAEPPTFAFLEVNTRLQVEHPVTELVTGLDLVALQLRVAAGEPLPFTQADLATDGHAIEARLYAEDPAAGYLPSTGRVAAFGVPEVEGARVDAGVRAGDVVSPHYDPLLAKVVAHGSTRVEATARLARALDRAVVHVVPDGPGGRLPATNRDLLVAVLRHPAFEAGETPTDFLDEHFPDDASRRRDVTPNTLTGAAVAATLATRARRRASAPVLSTLPAGWSNTTSPDGPVVYDHGDSTVTVGCRRGRESTVAVTVTVAEASDGEAPRAVDHVALVHACDGEAIDLELDGHRQRCQVVSVPLGRSGQDGPVAHHVLTGSDRAVLVERPRIAPTVADEDPGATLAPMPGSIATVAVAEGERVARGQLLVTIEAMKMEHRVTAPADGTVAEIRVAPGDQVTADELLVLLDAPDPT